MTHCASGRDAATPTVSRLQPDAVTAYQPAKVTIEGSGLASASRIWFDAISVTNFTTLDDSEILVTPPQLMAIGAVTVRVETPWGLSAARTLKITGPGDPVFVGPEVVTRGATSLRQFHVYSGKGWRSLVLVSDSDQPSTIPGLYNLGIGNQWQGALISVTSLNHDLRGAGLFILPFPTTLPSVTVYLQALSVDPAAIQTPFPVSGVHKLSIK